MTTTSGTQARSRPRSTPSKSAPTAVSSPPAWSSTTRAASSHARSQYEEVTLLELLAARIAEIHPSSFLFERTALLYRIGLVNEELPGAYGEDYDLMLRAARVAPLLCVREPLVDVYWHQSSFFASKWETIVDAHSYLLEAHPEYRKQPRFGAWHEGKIAFAYAALGKRQDARRWAVRALRHQLTQKQALVALAASFRLLNPTWVQKLAQRTGRGV